MSVEIAWKQNILVTDSNLLKSLLVVWFAGIRLWIQQTKHLQCTQQNCDAVALSKKVV